MSTNIISNAIDGLNKAAVKRAEEQAAGIIQSIRSHLSAIATNDANIATLQKDIKDLEKDSVSFEQVVGLTPRNMANTDTILKAIAEINKCRQSEVHTRATHITSRITQLQESNVALNREVAKLQEQLSKVTPETVTEAVVVG